MHRCPICWHENEWKNIYCGHCGKKLPDEAGLRSQHISRISHGLRRITQYVRRSVGIYTMIRAVYAENEEREKAAHRTFLLTTILVCVLLVIVIAVLFQDLQQRGFLPHTL